MQQLEGFEILTALDLNMGYYMIQLYYKSKYITTIETEFGKIRYNILQMEMVSSGDIFQAKVNELLGNIEGLKAYIDYILVLYKCNFVDNVEQLRICFSRICKSGLNNNANKCSFKLKKITYLWYIITREGLKPVLNKIQGIMDIQLPKTTTDCRNIIGAVQYYWGIWKLIPHVFSPITEASVGKNCKPIEWMQYLEQYFVYHKSIIS